MQDSLQDSCAIQSMSFILERISDAFIALDNDFNFIYLNDPAAKIFMVSKEEMINRCIWSIHPDIYKTEVYRQLTMSLDKREPVEFEHHGLRTGRWYKVKGYPSENGLSVFFIDITEKKVMDKELFRLEALNLIGEVSASIGHEIRNPITTVKGFLQLLSSNGSSPTKEHYDLMIDELNRANEIITDFLSLAADNTSSLSSKNLNDILESLRPLIQADAYAGNKLVEFALREVPDLQLNENEIKQLILNLVRNGFEAMSHGGKLTIGTYKENKEIVLSVKDQGHGINEEVLDRIWVPFFTTKENGTGLGLAVCYKIVNKYNGRIETITGNSGTTFLVRFKI